jgi:hypothetical protein
MILRFLAASAGLLPASISIASAVDTNVSVKPTQVSPVKRTSGLG